MADVYVQLQGLGVWLARPRLPNAIVTATSQSSAPGAPGQLDLVDDLPNLCRPGLRRVMLGLAALDAALLGQAGLLDRGDTVPAGQPLADGGGKLQRPFRCGLYLGRAAEDRERSDNSSGETARNRTARDHGTHCTRRARPEAKGPRAGCSQQ